jgi:hypothetical protein
VAAAYAGGGGGGGGAPSCDDTLSPRQRAAARKPTAAFASATRRFSGGGGGAAAAAPDYATWDGREGTLWGDPAQLGPGVHLRLEDWAKRGSSSGGGRGRAASAGALQGGGGAAAGFGSGVGRQSPVSKAAVAVPGPGREKAGVLQPRMGCQDERQVFESRLMWDLPTLHSATHRPHTPPPIRRRLQRPPLRRCRPPRLHPRPQPRCF